jgi:hypothetical protein
VSDGEIQRLNKLTDEGRMRDDEMTQTTKSRVDSCAHGHTTKATGCVSCELLHGHSRPAKPAVIPWRVAPEPPSPAKLIEARHRIERAIAQLVGAHQQEKPGYDAYDGDMDWLMSEVASAFFRIVEREYSPAQTWGVAVPGVPEPASMRRLDTPESRAFWVSVDDASRQWARTKPMWLEDR